MKNILRTVLLIACVMANPSFAVEPPATGGTGVDFTWEKEIFVPMRDGVNLSTDVLLPKGVEGPFPTVLIRTPYHKDNHWAFSGQFDRVFLQNGYAVVIQSERGCHFSEGEYGTYLAGARTDGYDAATWIVSQPWSNGKVVLHVSSTAQDTDFMVKLVDVHPDGAAFNLYDDAFRVRYREGYDREVLMAEGEVYEITLDNFVTANHFAPGHRLRIDITSSNFPIYERNLNTGGNNFDETEWVTATNTVHHSATYPSHVVLPIIPD